MWHRAKRTPVLLSLLALVWGCPPARPASAARELGQGGGPAGARMDGGAPRAHAAGASNANPTQHAVTAPPVVPPPPIDLRAVALGAAGEALSLSTSPLDLPIAQVWPAVNSWNETFEREYSEFVAQLGRAVSQRRCRRLGDCLRMPEANSLFDPATDPRLNLNVDCADLPYILRAYFAFKRRLPFGYVAATRGRHGRDPRYAVGIRPARFHVWRDFRTPRLLLHGISEQVHSGMYRTAPHVENGDFYPVAVNRRAIRPGTVFYDPNGHVLVVAEVRPDGMVHFMDGHPDGSLTWKRFGQAFVVGTAGLGGGFRNFRPYTWNGTVLTRAANSALPLFDGGAQYNNAGFVVGGQPSGYHPWVRASLAETAVPTDPVQEFREQVGALCRDVSDRATAVEMALTDRVHQQPHPSALPTNIYGTDGDWEMYSTPSRDARLKAAFRELRDTVAALPNLAALVPTLRTIWREETARPDCQFSYRNTAGATVSLTLDTVLDRLFAMSFDPYHCVELRWGALPGSDEARTCTDDASRRWWYQAEQRLRNRIDREYGVPTPLEFGPDQSPDVDVRRVIGLTPANNAAPTAPAPREQTAAR